MRSIAKLVYPSIVSAKVYEQFLHLTKRSFAQVISDIITERFKTAITKEEENANATNTEEVQNDSKESQIVTTAEELEGFYVVKSALRGSVEVDRIFYRDTVSYFGILLDNNNRKPVCRLHFNSTRKFLSVFDEHRKEVRYEINSMDDIFKYVDMMKRCIEQYDNPSKPSVESVPAVSSIDSLPE